MSKSERRRQSKINKRNQSRKNRLNRNKGNMEDTLVFSFKPSEEIPLGDNIVEVNEIVKSTLHNSSLKGQGKIIDTNDYDEYFIGGIKSFSSDPFFRSVVGNTAVLPILEREMKEGFTDWVTEGSSTGMIHIVHWSHDHECFLVWKHLLKDSLHNMIMKNGGKVFKTHQGQGMGSIVNNFSNLKPQKSTRLL